MSALGFFLVSTSLRIYQLSKLSGEERRRARREVEIASASTGREGRIISSQRKNGCSARQRRAGMRHEQHAEAIQTLSLSAQTRWRLISVRFVEDRGDNTNLIVISMSRDRVEPAWLMRSVCLLVIQRADRMLRWHLRRIFFCLLVFRICKKYLPIFVHYSYPAINYISEELAEFQTCTLYYRVFLTLLKSRQSKNTHTHTHKAADSHSAGPACSVFLAGGAFFF